MHLRLPDFPRQFAGRRLCGAGIRPRRPKRPWRRTLPRRSRSWTVFQGRARQGRFRGGYRPVDPEVVILESVARSTRRGISLAHAKSDAEFLQSAQVERARRTARVNGDLRGIASLTESKSSTKANLGDRRRGIDDPSKGSVRPLENRSHSTGRPSEELNMRRQTTALLIRAHCSCRPWRPRAPRARPSSAGATLFRTPTGRDRRTPAILIVDGRIAATGPFAESLSGRRHVRAVRRRNRGRRLPEQSRAFHRAEIRARLQARGGTDCVARDMLNRFGSRQSWTRPRTSSTRVPSNPCRCRGSRGTTILTPVAPLSEGWHSFLTCGTCRPSSSRNSPRRRP